MIQFEGVSKSFGPVQAVRHLDLRVEGGEIFGFLGPNGAGKTTTIKMATGMLRPTRGRILIGGRDVHREGAAVRQTVGYVPDQPHVYGKLTGHEFLEFVAELYGIDARQSRERSAELLCLFDLQEQATQLIESYSHGMRQKLVIASVLIHEPKVIFLDEPTTALDPKSARLVKDILRTLCRRGGTVFMSTHVMEIAEQMCERVAIIDRGQIVAIGTPSELEELQGQTSLEDVFLSLTEATAGSPLGLFGEPDS